MTGKNLEETLTETNLTLGELHKYAKFLYDNAHLFKGYLEDNMPFEQYEDYKEDHSRRKTAYLFKYGVMLLKEDEKFVKYVKNTMEEMF